jgi:hypothetical protein
MGAPPSTLPQLTVDHNLSDGARDPEFEIYGVDDLLDASPRFVSPSRGDYHLRSVSPAIDAGSAANAPAYDVDGDPRPQDGDGDGIAAHDIGADEWGERARATGRRVAGRHVAHQTRKGHLCMAWSSLRRNAACWRTPGEARSLHVLVPPEDPPLLENPDGREHA